MLGILPQIPGAQPFLHVVSVLAEVSSSRMTIKVVSKAIMALYSDASSRWIVDRAQALLGRVSSVDIINFATSVVIRQQLLVKMYTQIVRPVSLLSVV